LVALLALLITAAYRCVGAIQVTSTAAPYVEVEEVGISTDVRSIVTDNRVAGTPRVTTEKVLCRLDPGEVDIAVENATADLAETALTVRSMNLEAGAC
jgi:membrane fusion protein, multidrug efflux system